jgi:hypothetical protein
MSLTTISIATGLSIVNTFLHSPQYFWQRFDGIAGSALGGSDSLR